MARLELFLFDLAGTTVRDDQRVPRTFAAVCDQFSVPLRPAQLKTRMGMHKQAVFAALLAEAGMTGDRAPALAAAFEVEFAALADREPLQPTVGAHAAIAAVQALGVRVGFTTGFARSTANLILQRLGWSDHVAVASDEVASGRPAPDLILTAMQRCGVAAASAVGVAGDTPADLLAGTAAGARLVVGVGCGTHTLAELRVHPHTHLLDDLTALPALVASQR
jgi:phosphonatase-like hydrolase